MVQLLGSELHHFIPNVFADPSDQLRLYSARAQRCGPIRFLLEGGASRLVPGSGHAGRRHGDGLELCVHAGVGGQLWREWR